MPGIDGNPGANGLQGRFGKDGEEGKTSITEFGVQTVNFTPIGK
jgi:hypothetical protein